MPIWPPVETRPPARADPAAISDAASGLSVGVIGLQRTPIGCPDFRGMAFRTTELRSQIGVLYVPLPRGSGTLIVSSRKVGAAQVPAVGSREQVELARRRVAAAPRRRTRTLPSVLGTRRDRAGRRVPGVWPH